MIGRMVTFNLKAAFDPMLDAIIHESQTCPAFHEQVKVLCSANRAAVVSHSKDGTLFVYPSDDLLDLFYNHMAAKEKR